ncbi:MAG: dihydrolipoamide acetyltransferase family protein, partial [Bacteroidota bacterium]
MAQVELIMPKMGESIMEATILKWVKQVGDAVEVDETILEIATDKVDSEVPSPVSGTIAKIMFEEDETVEIGKVIALISTEGEAPVASPAVQENSPAATSNSTSEPAAPVSQNGHAPLAQPATAVAAVVEEVPRNSASGRFYSPLVRNIAKQENIGLAELEQVSGTGQNGRVTKKDMLAYVQQRTAAPATAVAPTAPKAPKPASPAATSVSGNVEIVEMDRMRRLIADHMVNSKHTSPHVTSFVEIDVTNLFNWRNTNKKAFLERYGEKITFTPIFMEAVVKSIKDFPMVNVSVDGTNLIIKKDINIGMATAL